jgi:hypothetical protein
MVFLGTSLICLVFLLTGCQDAEITPPPAASPSPSSTAQSPTTPVTPRVTESSPAPPSTTKPANVTQTPTQTPTPTPSTTISGPNIIIDHTNWNWYAGQPQSVFDAVAKIRIYFTHASVGDNILEGCANLNKSSPGQYPLVKSSVKSSAPGSTKAGTIYEYQRGNPDWSEKIKIFESAVNNGWHDPAVDMAMNKFCYIDPAADWKVYTSSMAALETRYPNTKFIYWTMPLTVDKDEDAVNRAIFNINLRAWIAGQNNKILFDLADIESWTADGKSQTFTVDGKTYERMVPAYSSDGGHLNSAGEQRVATGLYSLFGRVLK